jgi:hypothetical protein
LVPTFRGFCHKSSFFELLLSQEQILTLAFYLMLIKGGSEQAQGMFSKFGIRTVKGEGSIHMSNSEKREE